MKYSLNWLKRYVDLDASVEQLAHAITFLGFEVEGIERTGLAPLSSVVVGEILTRDRHPNADRLSLCTVDTGPVHGVKTIVCGAQNHKPGDRVPVALPGAVLPGGFTIKQSKIRGQSSDGMMCSAKELGLPPDVDGLLILQNRPAPGTPINEVFPGGDVIFDVEITPNRPDVLCHIGMARELAAWFRRELRYPELRSAGMDVAEPPASDILAAVDVEAPDDCPLYTAHLIRGVKIAPSPAWLQEALVSAGLRPVNNVVDVTNFVMLEAGQPLHAFDAARISGRRLCIRLAAEGEKMVMLDGKERALTGRMLVIADESRPLALAGIMGGMDSGVTDGTADIVLEAAYFRTGSIRWTSRNAGLASDSSYRFERGVDFHGVVAAARRAVELIIETAGGEWVGPVFRVGAEPAWESEIELSPDFVRRQAGFNIPDEKIREALEALELAVLHVKETHGKPPCWVVSVPSWRDDLERPVDLVEEVLRLYGTDKVPPGRVEAVGIPGDDDPVAAYVRRAVEHLAGQNFHECVNYTLRPKAELKDWASGASVQELALDNPISEEQTHLRSTLLPGLLESLGLNQARGVEARRLCETGRVFIESGGEVYEAVSAAFLICVSDSAADWRPAAPVDFYSAKSLTAVLAGLAGVALDDGALVPAAGQAGGWQEGHAARAGSIREAGWQAEFGLVSPALVSRGGIRGQVYGGCFTILPDNLAVPGGPRRYRPISHFPAALRDIALVAPKTTAAEALRRNVEELARKGVAGTGFEVEGVRIFDVYEGQGLPEGSRSLAFSLAYRSPDRTLTDDEVNAAFKKLQDDLAAAGHSVRK